MKEMQNTFKSLLASAFFLIAILSVSHKAEAASVSFSTDTDPCPATFTASVPDNLTPGQEVTISGSVSMSAPCQIDAPSMSFSGPTGGGSIDLQYSGSWTYYEGTGTLTVPSTPGSYYITVSGNVSSNLGGGPVYASDALYITVAAQTGTVTVSSCPQGGSFMLSGQGQVYTSSPATVQPGTYSLSYTPPANYNYSISPASSQSVTAGGEIGFAVNCTYVGQPTANISASQTNLSCGETATIEWWSQYATSCSNNFNSSTALSGSATVSPVGTQTYTVTCGNATVSDTKSVQVTGPSAGQCTPPSNPVSVDMSASPTLVNSGETSTISWSAPAATTCTATSPAGWTSKTSNSGSEVVTVTATTTYSMNCSNATDSGNGSVTVNVRPESYAWISVTSNIANSPWTLNPGNATGYGNGMKTPSISGPTLFSLTPDAVTGYTYTVSNSDGGTNSMMVSPGDSKSFAITYAPDNNSFNYTLSNSGNITLQKPTSPVQRTETIYKRKVGGSGAPTGTVSVDANSVPAGVSISYANRNCSPDCDTTITLTIDSSVAVGTHPITVNGNPQSQSTTFNLIIQNSSAPVVSCTPSASAAKVGDTITWTGGVSGGTAPYSYRWSGSGIPTSPAPSTQNYSMKYTTVGTKAATLQVTDANGQVGSCTPPGTVQVDFNPKFQEF